MASRFWVGGTGTWDASTTTHWSATSGGAGGVSVPTATDDVLLDGNAGAGTVTVSVGSCNGLDFTGWAGTLTGAAASLNCNSVNFGTTGTFSSPPTLNIRPGAGVTATITTNGRTWPSAIAINANATGTVLLAGALTTGGSFTHNSGTFDTGGFAWQSTTYTASSTTSKTLNLNASTVTMTNGAGAWGAGTAGINLTVNPGTSTIITNAASAGFNGGGLNYWNLVMNGSGAPTISGNNTFNNVTRTGTAAKTDSFLLGGNVTCTGTFTVNGNSVVNRIWVQSSVPGTQRTITAASVSVSNADFQDIAGAGAGNWNLSAVTGLSGDCGGNSGITFTPSATQTRSGAGGAWSTAASWTSRVPLPQDDDVVGSGASGTITTDMPRVGRSLDFTGFTGTWTVNTTISLFGSLTLASGMTLTGGQVVNLSGRGVCTVTSAGKTLPFTQLVFTQIIGGSYTLQDALNLTNQLTFSDGTFNTNNFSVSAAVVVANGTNSASRPLVINGGTSTWTLTSPTNATPWNLFGVTGKTLDFSGSTVVVGAASATNRTFAGLGLTYGTLSYVVAGSTGTLVITGANTFGAINFSDITNARTLTLPASTTTTITNGANFNVNGTAGKLMTINSSIGGTAATLAITTGTVNIDYTSLQDITASVTTPAYAGSHSTSVSGNTNWVFGTLYTKSFADSVTNGDATVKAVTANKADSVTDTDAVSKTYTANKADIVSDADAASKTFTANRVDTVTDSDSLLKSLIKVAADSQASSDSRSKAVTHASSDATTASDSLAKQYAHNTSDSISVQEALAKSFGVNFADNNTVSDTLNKLFTKNLADTETEADSSSETNIQATLITADPLNTNLQGHTDSVSLQPTAGSVALQPQAENIGLLSNTDNLDLQPHSSNIALED